MCRSYGLPSAWMDPGLRRDDGYGDGYQIEGINSLNVIPAQAGIRPSKSGLPSAWMDPGLRRDDGYGDGYQIERINSQNVIPAQAGICPSCRS
ncbi:hypothetical protein SAMN04488557_0908 [Hyphomicrobium facile]|uniref:Uncharacterized protein n=1 Tax=Hyphomicrobium facile TaxID=51670 RepID=A0A1I7N078_9HYPH|nr:hypothetical protein SAMN04488557_0908 [Hyphomicrobium facile]